MANTGEMKFTLRKVDDRTAYTLAKKLLSHFKIVGDEKVQIELASGMSINEDKFRASNIKTGEFNIPRLSFSGISAHSQTPVSFHFERFPDRTVAHPTDPNFDFVTLNFTPNNSHWNENPQLVTKAVNLILENQAPTTGVGTGGDSEILRQLIVGQSATHQRMLEELNNAVKEMTARREEMEAEAVDRELHRQQEHARALDALESERQQLERHSHMSERRRIAKAIGDQIKTDTLMALKPKGVTQTAWAVFGATFSVGLFGAGSAFWSFYEFSKRQAAIRELFAKIDEAGINRETLPSMIGDQMWATDWYLIGRMVLSALVAVGFFTYAASWIKRYYDEDTRRQREMERFNNDILRASWIVEAVQEVKHEAKAELPPEWVEAVTRNMFDQNHHNSADEGILAMKALMGFAAKTKIGPDGMELEMNRRGNRKLSNTDTSGE